MDLFGILHGKMKLFTMRCLLKVANVETPKEAIKSKPYVRCALMYGFMLLDVFAICLVREKNVI